ncbi:hypothetical protein EV361DRAFT_804856 [Lentinula raphanica]|uniref:BED-type domain-containing protein n=1 Tax=Lentinula raphanica TaxID=153919 RepID=A0AA38UFJ7_9AGAR|nr:hypothetical protein F5878DRAFT_541742 [Lentinula raphanica]KAJ3968889.1 hypothetical protein EV361DRAFT_804856 [Lentinula raphanica]
MGKRPASEPSARAKTRKRARKATSRDTDDDNENATPTVATPSGAESEKSDREDEEIIDATEQVKADREAAIQKISKNRQALRIQNYSPEAIQLGKEVAKRKSTVYSFFHAEPEVEFGKKNTADYLVFCCTQCGEKIRQGINTGDRGSTSNMREHVKKCWGEDALTAVKDCTLEQARDAVKKYSKGKQTTLTLVIKTVKTWFKTFSTRPPEKEKIRWLQKEGRPNHYVPSKATVARDVKKLYEATKEQLAKELEAYEYLLPVELDCWSSPNHRAFMSIIGKVLRRNQEGIETLTSVLLDFVELPCSHSGINMAEALIRTLEEYRVQDKVSMEIDGV